VITHHVMPPIVLGYAGPAGKRPAEILATAALRIRTAPTAPNPILAALAWFFDEEAEHADRCVGFRTECPGGPCDCSGAALDPTVCEEWPQGHPCPVEEIHEDGHHHCRFCYGDDPQPASLALAHAYLDGGA
jgi:hypothetical protein